MVLNKAKLGIQADIFVDVTCGVVRFRAKDRAHLENTLKDTHHCLLVKLRALRQERWPSLGVAHIDPPGSHDTVNTDYAVLQRPQFSLALRHRLHDTPAIANNQEVHTP